MSSMKKVLILGANAGQADIIEYLNQIGWETHVCGHKKEGPGCDLAHKFYLVNTLDLEAVENLALDLNVDFIYSISSDSAITSATKVSEKLGLPYLLGGKYIDLFNSKTAFREFLNTNKIGVTKFISVNKINKISVTWNDFPCVVKPKDSQGQRGVQFVESEIEMRKAIDIAISLSISKEAIVEEFIDGHEFSTNVIVQDGAILLNEFSDRIVFEKKYFGLPKGHGLPITYVNEKQLEIARSYVNKIIEKLKIQNAVLYIQMKLKGDEPRIIEIAPRLDGCHIWKLIKHYRGIDLRMYAIKCLLGEKIDTSKYIQFPNIKRSVLEFYHLPPKEIFSLDKLNIKRNTAFTQFRYSEGERVLSINGKFEVVGYSINDEN